MSLLRQFVPIPTAKTIPQCVNSFNVSGYRAQHDWSAVFWIVPPAAAARESPLKLTSALEQCEKVCASHSYRKADGKRCDLFEFYWETAR